MIPDWSEGLPVKIGEFVRGLYEPSPETKGYWDGLRRKELLIKQCSVPRVCRMPCNGLLQKGKGRFIRIA
jgi:hypothetical protein